MTSLLDKINKLGLKMTDQRRTIVKVLAESNDHPDVELVYQRVVKIDKKIGIATVYRTIKLFEENNVLNRIDLGGKKARYEELTDNHHDHLIDIDTGEIIEFVEEEIEELQRIVAEKLGYKLVDHKMELFGKKIKQES